MTYIKQFIVKKKKKKKKNKKKKKKKKRINIMKYIIINIYCIYYVWLTNKTINHYYK